MRRRLGLCWNQTARSDALSCWLALALLGAPAARAGAQASSGVQLRVERCAGASFDLEGYERALEVELKVLNAASLVPGSAPEGESGPQLLVTLPGCADALMVTLRVRDHEASEALRASDFSGVGQARALALATIEALRVLTLQAQVASSLQPATPDAGAPGESLPSPAAEPEAAVEPAAEPEPAVEAAAEPKPAEPAAEPEREPAPKRVEPEPPARPRIAGPPPWLALHVRGGLGAIGALDAHVHAGAAIALWPSVWVKAELGYGQAGDQTALGSLLAQQAVLGGLFELRARPLSPIELWVATGLRAGLTVVSAELELALAPGQRTRDALGLLFHVPLELGVMLDSGDGFVVGAFLEPGVWLAGGRFKGPTGDDVGMPDQNGAPPRIELLGPSLQAGLILGYRF